MFFGNEVGNLPEGLISPVIISTIALPNSCPANQVCKIASALSAQGIFTGEPVLRTTKVFGFTCKTSSMR